MVDIGGVRVGVLGEFSSLVRVFGFVLADSDITVMGDLPLLEEVSYRYNLFGVSGLTSTGALPSLLSVRDLQFHDLPSLQILPSVPSLTQVAQTLMVTRCPALSGLDGLETITHVGGFLLLQDNERLESLAGLANLQDVQGRDGTDAVPGTVDIQRNPILPACEVEALAARLDPPAEAVRNVGNDDAAACPP